ncbi:MAG: chitobiase/beta-hexosaminidase C-terminal domain-containing protein [Desulfobacterales bacterium]|nr:chitobiase/beta-hexosaminidase C-terminal domain-containing protein [Desulfobacterales bacterium]
MRHHSTHLTLIYSLFIAACLLFCLSPAFAEDDSVCAAVQIEISQELTLERQAFDAHMRINNGLTHAALENINVDVWATNEDGEYVEISTEPDDTDASFFIRLDEMTNIDDVSGSGQVPADSSSDIHWLIIPAPGASNGLSSGTRYNVGATLTYTIGGEENTIEVSPDYIFVKPMPEITLDYFLPEQVYGDDPFTQEIEASTPFSLGVRVQNAGSGQAQELKIDSAQPKIVDNEQGLLINFTITGSEVNGEEKTESLLVDFGTIEPNSAAVARWIMTCSLSGKFVAFDASFTHADELGGELTSLITDVNTHTLVRDVLVDLPGRDAIRDFLSQADNLFTVYESDNTETQVSDGSADSTLTFKENIGDESHYTLETSPVSGFIYINLPDPHAGAKYLDRVIRSDGKEVSLDNAWLSKVQDSDTHEWSHFVNLFDVNTTASYTLVFNAISASPQAPVLQYISDKTTLENQQVSFLVEASDPNGTIPALSAAPLPAGAFFSDNGDGTGIFDWTPLDGQKGIYTITFTASDGTLSSEQQITIIVFDANDSDMDGMTDDWEMTHFQDLDRDGTGDFDQDGITDLEEFEDQTNPILDESAPTVPDPLYPHPNIPVEDSTPELVVENSSDSQGDDIDYAFEIYEDEQMTQPVASQDRVALTRTPSKFRIYNWVADTGDTIVPRSDTTTSWQVPVDLEDNTRYYWRVRSGDEEGSSLWAYYDFFVNKENDPPSAFTAASPLDNAGVDSLSPSLSVMNSTDADYDVVTYTFDLFSDDTLQTQVASSGPVSQGEGTTTSWTVPIELEDQTSYFWQVTADDGNGGTTATAVLTFYADTQNQAPRTPSNLTPDSSEEVEYTDILLTVTNVQDLDQDPVSYIFEIDTSDRFDSQDKQTSDLVSEGYDTTSWQVSGLKENTQYYWRVIATDGSAQSQWASSRFFVNQINDAPDTPTIKNPGAGAWTDTRTPVLSMHRANDPDQDTLEYQFEIYSNESLTRFVYQETSTTPDWTVPFELDNNTWYFWRARALDEHGVTSSWTEVSSFFIKTDYVNQAPVIEITQPFESVATNSSTLDIQWTDEDPDSSAVIALYYDTDAQGEDGILIAENLQEDEEGDQDTFTWDISGLSDGTYYIYAQIYDEGSIYTHYAPVSITIDRTPPVLAISPEAGEYQGLVSIEVSTDEAATIYYSLDGSTPGQGSTQYIDPIELTSSATLKCVAMDALGNTSSVETREYIVGLDMVTLEVVTDKGAPISDAKVHLKKKGRSFGFGKWKLKTTTNDQGIAEFDPDDIRAGTYQYKVEYLGSRFWSDEVLLPDTMYTRMEIPVETVELTISSANGPVAGYNVYLFSQSGEYLGQTQITDDNGLVTFELPAGEIYTFMADVLGNQYWTDPTQVQSGGTNQITYDAGGGLLTVTLQKDSFEPIADIKLYLYNPDGTYLGESAITNENGQVEFELTDGDYTVRADYLGYCFWTETATVLEDTALDLTLDHKDVIVTVKGKFRKNKTPMADIQTSLFTPDGASVDQSAVTDENGHAVYSLPDRAFKVKAELLGRQYWSRTFTSKDTRIKIPMARAKVFVTGSGQLMEDTLVHVFSGAGTDLDVSGHTKTNGLAKFNIPAGRYIFKAEYGDNLFQSRRVTLPRGISMPVHIAVGDGMLEFTALKSSGQPIQGAKVHVLTADKSDTGLSSATNTHGQAFFDLLDGTYMFRLDYMNQEYFSDPVTLPDTLTASMEIPHQDVRVALSTRNAPVADTIVYLFSKTGHYLGSSGITDASGNVVFTLPAGLEAKFQADVSGCQFWSDPITIKENKTNDVDFNTGGGTLTLNLLKKDHTPISGTKIILLTKDDEYTGLWGKTDHKGQVSFEVPRAKFKAETIYRGRLFRSEAIKVKSNKTLDFVLPEKPGHHQKPGHSKFNHQRK